MGLGITPVELNVCFRYVDAESCRAAYTKSRRSKLIRKERARRLQAGGRLLRQRRVLLSGTWYKLLVAREDDVLPRSTLILAAFIESLSLPAQAHDIYSHLKDASGLRACLSAITLQRLG